MLNRRKHERFKLNDVCVISHSRAVGTVLNISVGGLACMCFDQGECMKGVATPINIYCKEHDICAEGLTIKVLNSELVEGEFIEDLGLRRCRAMFSQLEEDHVKQLTNIIVKSSLTSSDSF